MNQRIGALMAIIVMTTIAGGGAAAALPDLFGKIVTIHSGTFALVQDTAQFNGFALEVARKGMAVGPR